MGRFGGAACLAGGTGLVAAAAVVAAPAATWGQEPAILFHDYGGTLLVVGWLFGFWMFVQRWIPRPEPSEDLEMA